MTELTIHSVKGFRVAGAHGGLKPDNKPDIALITSDLPCRAAGVFTTNRIKAAPVLYDQSVLSDPSAGIRAIVANAGNANACTGEQGMTNTRLTAEHAAGRLGCRPDEVLVLSTGVIGVQLPMEAVIKGIDAAAEVLDAEAWEGANRAIMTTDTRPKMAGIINEEGYTITGIAKGAGMIAPNMATMLAIIATDADVPRAVLTDALQAAVKKSFNRIVVDGDMSTNDTVLLLANGASGVTIAEGDAQFQMAIEQVCTLLAQSIVRDGEGATRFVTIEVAGAPTTAQAEAVAQSIARSPLCKTAFYGSDPNWGRILCAAGYSGIDIQPDRLSLWLLDPDYSLSYHLVEGGRPRDYDEAAAITLMKQPEWVFRLDLGMGQEAAKVWTCDFSYEYVTINGHYRT
ncbi:MAG: bifunctional glutamate N-acetyltransferase/amino-acid acetyltransferase ArgJ [Anaerolineae bacterium]|nr:bifunctional glutamate N-acetyltransferase/amino-acid acetyltransferase ArgJ [Anaerolineae bacterium]